MDINLWFIYLKAYEKKKIILQVLFSCIMYTKYIIIKSNITVAYDTPILSLSIKTLEAETYNSQSFLIFVLSIFVVHVYCALHKRAVLTSSCSTENRYIKTVNSPQNNYLYAFCKSKIYIVILCRHNNI